MTDHLVGANKMVGRDHLPDATKMVAVTEADRLRWRLPSFQRKVENARARVRAMLEASKNPYMALSGGKDSLVVLALVCEQRPGIDAVFCDDELELAETVPYLRRLAEHLPFRLRIGKCYSMAPIDWIVPWTERPYWREPEPDMEDFGDSIKVAARRHGYDGAFVGLRAEEAMIRRMNLARRGMLYQVADGMWHSQPIARWSVDEVWAVIAGMELPYHPAYDEMAAARVEREKQRIGALGLAPGWLLERVWPQTYRGLIDRYGPRW